MRVALLAGVMLCLSAAAAVPAGAAPLAGGPPTYQESFERDFGGWTPDTDGLARGWKIYRTTEDAADGDFSLAYWLDGRNDDGTIWIERPFAAPFRGTALVDVVFQVSGPAPDITGWPIVATASAHNPKAESDFTIVGRAGEKVGWVKYALHTKVAAPMTGVIWVAVGVSATWETIRTHHLDLVEVTITPTAS